MTRISFFSLFAFLVASLSGCPSGGSVAFCDMNPSLCAPNGERCESCGDPSQPYCIAQNSCGECSDDSHCAGSQSCNLMTGQCGECHDDQDCSAGRCDPRSFQCVECITNAECSSSESCTNGTCSSCADGTFDCDGDGSNGCEASITDESSCGGCGIVCEAGEMCTSNGCLGVDAKVLATFNHDVAGFDANVDDDVVTFWDRNSWFNGTEKRYGVRRAEEIGKTWTLVESHSLDQSYVRHVRLVEGGFDAFVGSRGPGMTGGENFLVETSVGYFHDGRIDEIWGAHYKSSEHAYHQFSDSKDLLFCGVIGLTNAWHSKVVNEAGLIGTVKDLCNRSTYYLTEDVRVIGSGAPQNPYLKAGKQSGVVANAECVYRFGDESWHLCIESAPMNTPVHELSSEDSVALLVETRSERVRIDGHPFITNAIPDGFVALEIDTESGSVVSHAVLPPVLEIDGAETNVEYHHLTADGDLIFSFLRGGNFGIGRYHPADKSVVYFELFDVSAASSSVELSFKYDGSDDGMTQSYIVLFSNDRFSAVARVREQVSQN